MSRRIVLLVALIALVLAVPTGLAQEGGTVLEEPVHIDWPPPVSEVWGTGDVIGTAAVPGMAYYYLEYLPLNDDLTFPTGAPWLPATVGITQPVVNGTLATLDTTRVTDGLYALRLTVNTLEGDTYTDTVSPIRVNNTRFDSFLNRFREAILEELGLLPEGEGEPTATPIPPTQIPPTQPPPTDPYVSPLPGTPSVNVRRCNVVDNYSCAIVGYLLGGERADVTGRDATGAAWLQIRLPAGLVGWVSTGVVTIAGDLGSVPFVTPPGPLPPPAQSNVLVNGISISGSTTCGVTFNAQVNVANTGNAASPAGQVTLQDVDFASGQITSTNYGNYPSIGADGNFVVTIPLTITAYYNANHELRAYTNNTQVKAQYFLSQGNCNQPPTAVPPTQPPPYQPGDCAVVTNQPETSVFDSPGGNLLARVPSDLYPISSWQDQGGVVWYNITYDDPIQRDMIQRPGWMVDYANTFGYAGRCDAVPR
ncbi:MAG: hypothetical protein IPK19_36390 [Chloroflexi bacterium]|nr:hypothetical protein [Chloroflexota bacterium]